MTLGWTWRIIGERSGGEPAPEPHPEWDSFGELQILSQQGMGDHESGSNQMNRGEPNQQVQATLASAPDLRRWLSEMK